MSAVVDRTKELADLAKRGDLEAGKKLIELCRRGMVVPNGEVPQEITMEVVEKHLERRVRIGGGKATI